MYLCPGPLAKCPSRAGCPMRRTLRDNCGTNRRLRWSWDLNLGALWSHPFLLSLATLPSLQLARYTKEGFLHLGALGTTTLLPDTRCLVDNSKSRLPQLLDCDKVKSSLYKRWNFIQVSSLGTGLGEEQVQMLPATGGPQDGWCPQDSLHSATGEPDLPARGHDHEPNSRRTGRGISGRHSLPDSITSIGYSIGYRLRISGFLNTTKHSLTGLRKLDLT